MSGARVEMANPMHNPRPADGGASTSAGAPAEPRYIEKDIKLLVCTWNVGNKQPLFDLSPWIPAAGGEYDLIVVGVQECSYKVKGGRSGAASSGAAAMPNVQRDDTNPITLLEEAAESDSDDEEDAAASPSAGAAGGAAAAASLGPAPLVAIPEPSGINSDAPSPATTAPASAVASAAASAAASPAARADAGAAGFKPTPAAPVAVSASSASAAVAPPTPASGTPPSGATGGAAASATDSTASIAPARGSIASTGATGGVGARPSQWLSALVSGGITTYIKNANSLAASEKSPIFEIVRNHLGPGWTDVRGVLMWQTGILVMARNSTILPHIDAVESGSEATGVLGVGQNKGGTAVSMRVYGTPLAFISSHLAAHMKHVDDRNSNVEEILENIRIGSLALAAPYTHVDVDGTAAAAADGAGAAASGAVPLGGGSPGPAAAAGSVAAAAAGGASGGAGASPVPPPAGSPPPPTPGIARLSMFGASAASASGEAVAIESPIDLDHAASHCFFFGDMNYRVDLAIGGKQPPGAPADPGHDTPEARAAVLALIEAGKLGELLECDQLREAMRDNRVLAGYREHDITFPPTFKMNKEAGYKYKAQRVSSWCDRILWRSHPGLVSDVRCTSYSAHPEIASSDHKPVSASFTLRARTPYTPPAALVAAPVRAEALTKVKLTNVKGTGLIGMDVTGLSDCYLMFYSIPGDVLVPHGSSSKAGAGVPKTAFKHQTLSPAWSDSEIPELKLRATGPEDLAYVHLVIGLMDYDLLDAHDRMGQCILHLGAYAHATGPIDFTVPVIKAGVRHGELSGRLQLTYPAAGSLAASAAALPTSVAATGQCCDPKTCTVQ